MVLVRISPLVNNPGSQATLTAAYVRHQPRNLSIVFSISITTTTQKEEVIEKTYIVTNPTQVRSWDYVNIRTKVKYILIGTSTD